MRGSYEGTEIIGRLMRLFCGSGAGISLVECWG